MGDIMYDTTFVHYIGTKSICPISWNKHPLMNSYLYTYNV